MIKKVSNCLTVNCLFCQNGATCGEAMSTVCHCADGYYGDGCGKTMIKYYKDWH